MNIPEGVQCVMTESSAGNTRFEGAETQRGQEEWAHKWDKNTITYSVIRGTDDLPGDYPERIAVNLAMTTWDVEIRPNLKWVPRDQNPDITIEFRNQEDDDLFKNNPGVLAYAYFPKTSREGEIVFNDHYIWTLHGKDISAEEYTRLTGRPVSDPRNTFRTYNLIHTLIHEIGHSLGLRHATINNGADIMDAIYNGLLDLSGYDIYRIRLKYPIRVFVHWIRYSILKRWLKRRKLKFQNNT